MIATLGSALLFIVMFFTALSVMLFVVVRMESTLERARQTTQRRESGRERSHA
jgi:hypothetical protein